MPQGAFKFQEAEKKGGDWLILIKRFYYGNAFITVVINYQRVVVKASGQT